MTSGVAIGIGCRSGVSCESIVTLVRAAAKDAHLSLTNATIFTIDAKADERSLAQAAEELCAPLVFLPRAVLAQIATPTQSPASQKRFSVASVSESAALAGAGEGAVLAVRRVVQDGVTCAIAHRP